MGTDKVFKLGKKEFRAEELSALVLKNLIADAEAALDTFLSILMNDIVVRSPDPGFWSNLAIQEVAAILLFLSRALGPYMMFWEKFCFPPACFPQNPRWPPTWPPQWEKLSSA